MAHNYTLKEGTPEYVGDILSTLETQGKLNETWQRCFAAYQDEIGKLWADNAELRDEINAVANRVESLTRAVMADPAEVAQAIVNDANRSTLRATMERIPPALCTSPTCAYRSDQHYHQDDGSVAIV